VLNPFLVGEKTYLRPLEQSDVPLLVRWINDPEVTRTMSMFRPMTSGAESAFLDQVAKSEHDVVLGLSTRDDRLIGVAGLHGVDYQARRAEFGIFIGEKGEWGKGYGREATRLIVSYAFETLNLNKVALRVVETNERGIRAYEKVGFKKEGVLRQDFFREGRYLDVFMMAVLREEWASGSHG